MSNMLERARELEAEAKALRRQEKQFWDDVKERADEVKAFLGVGQNCENLSDGHAEAIGKAVEEICGSINDLDALKEYLNRYANAISRTQIAEDPEHVNFY